MLYHAFGRNRDKRRQSFIANLTTVQNYKALSCTKRPCACHKRHSPKRKVKDDVLGNGEELHIREHITVSYAYEEISYHVYDEILATPDSLEIPAEGRVNSRLSVEFNPVGERIYEMPYFDHEYRNSSSPNRPAGQRLYEEIRFGDHIYKNNALSARRLAEEHAYEEIPLGHHRCSSRPLPTIPQEEHVYEEIPFGNHLYEGRVLPNIPEEEHTQSVQDQSGYLQPDRQRSRVAGHMDPNFKVQDQSAYLQPDRQRSRTSEHTDPKVPSQCEPTEPYLRPNPRKTRSTEPIHVHVQRLQSHQRVPRSNPELGSAPNYSSPQTVQSGPTDADLQDRRHGTAVVSRNSGPVSPAAEPQTVPVYQGFAEEHHDTPQSDQSGPAYTGLKERRSEHTYAALACDLLN